MAEEKKKRVVFLIPTYNEKENIEALIQEILGLPLNDDLSLLVVDDNSPDGTGELVKQIAEKEKRVEVLIRRKRRGRGAAGLDGFKKALTLNPDYVIEMDADFSHQPEDIPRLLASCEKYDLVIGSRFVKGGKDQNRSLLRRLITFVARSFLRHHFPVSVKDVSSGFRCFKRETLEKLDLDDFISVGPSLVLEILWKATLLNCQIGEVPIVFMNRKQGKTKLELLTLLETLIMVFRFKKIYANFRGRS